MFLLSSVLLEKNRWDNKLRDTPALQASEWCDKAQGAGFDGWELWENHWCKAPLNERLAIAKSSFPVIVFNSYLLPDKQIPEDKLEELQEAYESLGFRAMKFNVSEQTGREEQARLGISLLA